MKFLIFKLENPLSCSHHSIQIRAKLAKIVFLAQLLMNLNEFTLLVLNYKSFPSHISLFFHFLRFHFIAEHHGIKITQIKKVEFSIKNENQLKRSSIVINKSSTWKTQFETQNVDLCSCFFFCAWKYFFSNEIAHFLVPGQIVNKSNKTTDQQCSKSI